MSAQQNQLQNVTKSEFETFLQKYNLNDVSVAFKHRKRSGISQNHGYEEHNFLLKVNYPPAL